MQAIDVQHIIGSSGGWCIESVSRLTGLGIVVRSLPQRPDTTDPGIRGGMSARENGRPETGDESDVRYLKHNSTFV